MKLFEDVKFALAVIGIIVILLLGAFNDLIPYIFEPFTFWHWAIFLIAAIPTIWFFLWLIISFFVWLFSIFK